jgi:hypothetical protein
MITRMRLRSATLGLGFLALGLGGACRRFEACASQVLCEASSGGSHSQAGGANGASAGEAGASGHAGTSGGRGGTDASGACVTPWLDCDQSTLNGCETDVRQDARHCGGCEQECRGLCGGSECLPFEVIVPAFFPLANVALTPEFAYFVAHPAFGGTASFKRVARGSGAEATIATSGFAGTDSVTAGSTRIYVVLGGALWSAAAISGEDLRREDLEVDAVSAGGAFLYFTQGQTVHRRLEGGTALEPLTEVTGNEALLAGAREGVFVGSNTPTGDDSSEFELVFIHEDFDQTTLQRGTGRLLSLAAGYDDVYFLVEHAGTRELRAASTSPNSALVLAEDASDVVALAPGDGFLFASFERAHVQGIRLYEVGLPREWHTRAPVLALTSDASGELWFFDDQEHVLVRADPLARERSPLD